MKGLDTVESLSAEASDNISTNSFCMICTNLGKILLVLLDLPKLGLLHTNHGKTALFYSIVTIYLGLRPRIKRPGVCIT